MGITRNGGDTFNSKVEFSSGKPSLFKERHNKTAETAINMKADVMLFSQFTQANNIIRNTVREVDSRARNLVFFC